MHWKVLKHAFPKPRHCCEIKSIELIFWFNPTEKGDHHQARLCGKKQSTETYYIYSLACLHIQIDKMLRSGLRVKEAKTLQNCCFKGKVDGQSGLKWAVQRHKIGQPKRHEMEGQRAMTVNAKGLSKPILGLEHHVFGKNWKPDKIFRISSIISLHRTRD